MSKNEVEYKVIFESTSELLMGYVINVDYMMEEPAVSSDLVVSVNKQTLNSSKNTYSTQIVNLSNQR